MRFAGNSEISQILLIALTVGPISAFLNNTAAVAIIPKDSSLVGETLATLALTKKFDIAVLQIIRNGQQLPTPLTDRSLAAGDSLIFHAGTQDLAKLQNDKDIVLQAERSAGEMDIRGANMELAEVVIAPGSMLIGTTLREVDFYNRYGASALAMMKHGMTVHNRLPDTPLELGDTLLLKAPTRVLLALKADPGFVVTDDMQQQPHRTHKIPSAVAIIAGVVLLAAFGVQSILVSAIEGCVLMVLTGCLHIRELHNAIRWDVIFLLAGLSLWGSPWRRQARRASSPPVWCPWPRIGPPRWCWAPSISWPCCSRA